MSTPEAERQARLRSLPALDRALAGVGQTAARLHRRMAVWIARRYLDEVRERIAAGEDARFEPAELKARLEEQVRPTLGRAVNGLGVVLHTGLGRSPLSKAAQEALAEVSEHFAALEINVRTGRRGSRYAHVEPLLCELTGAEAAMVVNNNCAATLLILTALAKGREVIVSRGQLIEIGGSFRIPDVMVQSGCRMVEVGTTNRTHLRDYVNAITPETAALLRVVQQPYRPNQVVAVASEGETARHPELVHHRPAQNGQATVYVCQNFTCRQPVTTVEALEELLEGAPTADG
uniref:L-seryl-tRNA(Sec) selenium transferase n=1 Tax=candidate division WOR-3 bacterium TaxID=2052148 RepID=A0A7C4CCL6_UNCW3